MPNVSHLLAVRAHDVSISGRLAEVRHAGARECDRLGHSFANDYLVSSSQYAIGQNVGAESATVNEGSKHRASRVALDDCTRFAETNSAATDCSNHELSAEKRVEIDAARDEIAAVFLRSQSRLK